MGSENVQVPLVLAVEVTAAADAATLGVAVVGVGVGAGVGAGVLLFLLFLASTVDGACVSAKMTKASTSRCLSLKWMATMAVNGN